MLAYVFWHWPQPTIERDAYVDHLKSFHVTLASNKPAGFRHSTVFLIRDVPWLNTDDEAFEEWYLLDDSSALDRLNDGAVSGPCEEPHNLVAREAADGIGGLYRLRAGYEDVADSRFAVWLEKPGGVSYRDFYTALQPLHTPNDVALWGRQMTLGPTKEFCLHSPNQIQLPPGLEGHPLALDLIWSGKPHV
jgi:hypothetical protein